MKHEFAPDRLDMRAFAQSSSQLAGSEPMARYRRILQECRGHGSELLVSWAARGEIRGAQPEMGQVWLHLHADLLAPLTCQRCLEVVDVPLLVDRSFRLVADEETAAALDDDSEEDLLVLAGDFNLHVLIEDELVLALPMIARHEVCPGQPALMASDAEFGVAVAGRPNPFTALARLKSNRGPK